MLFIKEKGAILNPQSVRKNLVPKKFVILSVHVTLSSTNHNKYNTILMVVAIFASDCSLTFALLAWLAMTTAAAITTVKKTLILSGCQPWLSLLVVSPDCQSGRPVQTLGMPPSFIQCGTPGGPAKDQPWVRGSCLPDQ